MGEFSGPLEDERSDGREKAGWIVLLQISHRREVRGIGRGEEKDEVEEEGKLAG